MVDVKDLPGKTLNTIKTRVLNKSHQFWRKNYVNWLTSNLQINEIRHFRKFWPEIDPSKSNKLMTAIGRNRKHFSIFVQATSGADYLNKHSYKMGQAETPFCRLCNEDTYEEDLLHMKTECPAMTTKVNNIFINKFPT